MPTIVPLLDPLAQADWAAPILDRLRREVARLQPDIPTATGGWMHNFSCPDHWTFLKYDPGEPQQSLCPAGHHVSGESVHGGWLVLRHRELADGAAKAALLAHFTGDQSAKAKARQILLDYAAHYAGYQGAAQAQPWMLKGRVFQQALTEGLWLSSLARAAWLMRPHLNESDWSTLQVHLLTPARQIMREAHQQQAYQNGKQRSNFLAWILCAQGTLDVALDDSASLQQTLNDLEAHLKVSVLPDGFQWEGSPYYHTFVTLAYSLLIEVVEAAGISAYPRFAPTLERLWAVIPQTLWQNGEYIQRRDGSYWPDGPWQSELRDTLELAWSRTERPEYAQALNALSVSQQDSWTKLLRYVPRPALSAPLPPSHLFAHTGLAVIRGQPDKDGLRTEFTLDFGPHGGEHGHDDLLSLHFSRGPHRSVDPGSPPYANAIRREFYQQTAAHNTVVVNGQSQAHVSGKLLNFTPEGVQAAAEQAYPGVRLERKVSLSGADILDAFSVSGQAVQTIDWLFHGQGELVCDLPLHPFSNTVNPDGPYRFLDFQEASSWHNWPWQVRFRHTNGEFTVMGEVSQPYQLISATAPGPDEAPWLRRPLLILRVQAQEVLFNTRYLLS